MNLYWITKHSNLLIKYKFVYVVNICLFNIYRLIDKHMNHQL
jgi:hypothetical protein